MKSTLIKKLDDSMGSILFIYFPCLLLYLWIVLPIFEHNQRFLNFAINAENNVSYLKQSGKINQAQAQKYFALIKPLKNNQEISAFSKLLILPYVEKTFKTIYYEQDLLCKEIDLQVDSQSCQGISFNEIELKSFIEKDLLEIL